MTISNRRSASWFLAAMSLFLWNCGKKSIEPVIEQGSARTRFDQVEAGVSGLPSDAVLVYVGTNEVSVGGDAGTWTYVYYSTAENQHYGYRTLGDKIDSVEPESAEEMVTTPLPEEWIDSETAIDTAETNGGAAFRNRNTNCAVGMDLLMIDTTSMGLGKAVFPAETPPLPVWEMWYVSDEQEAVSIVNGITGELIVFQVLYERSSPITAREAWNIARTKYLEVSGGVLISVSTSMAHPDGKNVVWAFHYRYDSRLRFIGMDGGVLGQPQDPPQESEVRSDWPALPAGWIDSDAVLTVAESNGGAAYRSTHPSLDIELHLFPAGKAVMNRDFAMWEVFYGVTPTQGFGVAVNALTGAVVQ
ncbi:hypothetical protein JW906_00705 [bacterium]|nr:hypothetical protein [bacterium]